MTAEPSKPANLLLTYYGDDFTGSTDAMEALALSGFRTVLFLRPPEPGELTGRFRNVRCVGVAGDTRALTPEQMTLQFPPVLRKLKALGARLTHYKVCSTFDSGPEVGSIGRIIDLAVAQFPRVRTVPLLVGAPPLGRYTLFGHHFAAAAGTGIYRLDRHPTMSRHPVTPMDESDLRVHLRRQTSRATALMDILELDGDGAGLQAAFEAKLSEGDPNVLLFDVLDDRRLEAAAALIWGEAARTQLFVVGSSGVEYGLAAHWRTSGAAAGVQPAPEVQVPSVPQVLVVSGSASPVTSGQIQWALANGFEGIRAQAALLVDPATAEAARRNLFDGALAALSRGLSPLVYTATGPADPSIGQTRVRLEQSGRTRADTGRLLGEQLGRLASEVLAATGLRRLVIAGGDTASFATRELGLYGLEMIKPIAPGSPLCIAYAEESRFDGLQIALKGGQIGRSDYFGRVRDPN